MQILLVETHSGFLPNFSELEEHWMPHSPFSLQGLLTSNGIGLLWWRLWVKSKYFLIVSEINVFSVHLYKTNKETGSLCSPRMAKKSSGSIKSNQIIFWNWRLLKRTKKTWQHLPCPARQAMCYFRIPGMLYMIKNHLCCLYFFFLQTSAFGHWTICAWIWQHGWPFICHAEKD